MAAKKSSVTVPEFSLATMRINIVGLTPLLCNRIPEWVKDYLPGGKLHGEKAPADNRTWEEQALDGAYRHPETGVYVFPSSGLLAAMCSGAYRIGLTPDIVSSYTNLQIREEWVEIQGPAPRAGQDTARQKGGGALIMANRAEFKVWRMGYEVEFNAGVFTAKKIALMVNAAGMNGIGCWRPERHGRFGRFEIEFDLGTEG
jgi:hypothetical protein